MKRFGIENYFFEWNLLIKLVAIGYEGAHEIPRANKTIKHLKEKK